MMDEDRNMILLGGGGHAKVLMDMIMMSGEYTIAGILDARLEAGTFINGIAVLGGDELLPGLRADGITNACIAVGSVKDNSGRKALYGLARKHGYYIPSIIHPRAVVSSADTALPDGVQVMAGAIIQAGSRIGGNTIINTGAIVEHDCVIGKNVHICPGAVICGGSIIGDNAFVGAGATVIQGIEIGRGTVVGAGAVVRRNLTDGMLIRGAV